MGVDDHLPKPALSRWVKWIVAGAMLLLLLGLVHSCAGKRKVVDAPLSAAEAEFDRQGVILQEYCRQGVSFDAFSDQLVQVCAARRTAERDIRKREEIKWVMYGEAEAMWEITRRVWRLKNMGGSKLYPFEPILPKMLAELHDPMPPPEDGLLTEPLIRRGMSAGTDRFQAAMDFNFDAEIAKIEAARKKTK